MNNDKTNIPLQTGSPTPSFNTRWQPPNSESIFAVNGAQLDTIVQILEAAVKVLHDDAQFEGTLQPVLGNLVSIRKSENTYSYSRDDLPFIDIEVHFRRSRFHTDQVPGMVSIRADSKLLEGVQKDVLEARLGLVRSNSYLPDLPFSDSRENAFRYRIENTPQGGIYPLYVDIYYSRSGTFPLSIHEIEAPEHTRLFDEITLDRNWDPPRQLIENGVRIGESCMRNGVWRAVDLSALPPMELPNPQYIRRGTPMPPYYSGQNSSERNRNIKWYWVDDGLE